MGFPFVINTEDLPFTQCYFEYPDGFIKLITLTKGKLDFKVIAELTMQESDCIRKKYKIV